MLILNRSSRNYRAAWTAGKGIDLRWHLLQAFLAVCLCGMGNITTVHGQDLESGLLTEIHEPVSSMRIRAARYRQDGQWEKALEVHRRIVQLNSENALDWFYLGYVNHAMKNFSEAIIAYERSARSPRFRSTAEYNLGCAHAMNGNPDQAFDYLYLAIDHGFSRTELFQSDEDLDSLRTDARFQTLLDYAKGIYPPLDLSSLQGQWTVFEARRAGEAIDWFDRPRNLKIEGDRLTFDIKRESQTIECRFEVDTRTNPANIMLEFLEGGRNRIIQRDKTYGIVKMMAGKLTICLNPFRDVRPKRFVSDEDNGCVLLVLKPFSGEPEPFVNQMVGRWEFVSGQRAGKDYENANLKEKVFITESKIRMTAGRDDYFFEMSYEVDSASDPATIDLRIDSGPAPTGSLATGIIQIDGDTLSLCYDSEGMSRPREFSSTAENKFNLFQLKRVTK